MTDLKFICTSCGACCKRVKGIKDFPEPINEDGSCSQLDGTKCKIYDTRPECCRVGPATQALSTNLGHLSMKDYFKLSNSICNMFIIQDQLGDEYLIDIKAYDV